MERKAMRIPNDISLASYIRKLIRQDKVYLFYQTDEWKELRVDVLEELHYECQDCLVHGRYTRADCVHHHNEVRERPDLALSKYYTDAEGQRQRQLIPLCNACHNIRHEKLQRWQSRDKFINEERW